MSHERLNVLYDIMKEDRSFPEMVEHLRLLLKARSTNEVLQYLSALMGLEPRNLYNWHRQTPRRPDGPPLRLLRLIMTIVVNAVDLPRPKSFLPPQRTSTAKERLPNLATVGSSVELPEPKTKTKTKTSGVSKKQERLPNLAAAPGTSASTLKVHRPKMSP